MENRFARRLQRSVSPYASHQRSHQRSRQRSVSPLAGRRQRSPSPYASRRNPDRGRSPIRVPSASPSSRRSTTKVVGSGQGRNKYRDRSPMRLTATTPRTTQSSAATPSSSWSAAKAVGSNAAITVAPLFNEEERARLSLSFRPPIASQSDPHEVQHFQRGRESPQQHVPRLPWHSRILRHQPKGHDRQGKEGRYRHSGPRWYHRGPRPARPPYP
ncbi:uncharacterized protein J3D65DRAFT_322431 [Phyllosticta citribraziliensis]|uniref:Uncharacterized protein n=1 Tax=Phyllosticta citribraziliensis TaxID=989973 RepID=A0ABR1LSW8_9PEZI